MMLHSRRICNTLRKSSPALLQLKHASTNQRPPIPTLDQWDKRLLLGTVAAAAGGSLLYSKSSCEEPSITLSSLPALQEEPDEVADASLPIYTSAQVATHDGKKTNRVWMSYGGYVYDVTDFIENHPGGQQKILLAAGGAIEPYWHLYRQHFASDLPLRLMEEMIIGKLHPDDQDKIDAEMDKMMEKDGDPYEDEPERHPLLIVHSDTPMNAEVPVDIITKQYITPSNLFYIRNHHPVPLLSEEEVKDFRLEIDLTALYDVTNNASKDVQQTVAKLSLEQIKSLPKVEIVSTLQCSGNRRSGFNELRQTSGTNWGQGAISTAKWGGVRLVDLLQYAAQQVSTDATPERKKKTMNKKKADQSLIKTLQELQSILEKQANLQHLRMESLDGMHASIPIIKALSPFGDVILAYEMNDKPLPRDHGYPLRLIVPGYAAVRNVKWVSKLALNKEESEGPWQRGLNYKILPPAFVDASGVDLNRMPGLTEEPVISGITNLERVNTKRHGHTNVKPGDTVMVSASGWAWAGGGRNIVRVDVTGDDGKSWETATITQGSNQPFGRAWAWVFWECDNIPAKVLDDGHTVEVGCKGVDAAFNTQPQYVDGMWNVRGLANNAWYRLRAKV
ncbi:hypothetical protein ACHAWO_005122 [Cyclotella atomus]|uniref:Cytochrome b5 heme-binding domain-containing protein n=1 Tax=Cyclotella atomus TaxID=382360 RepID=A0ABD3PGF9_9STRA